MHLTGKTYVLLFMTVTLAVLECCTPKAGKNILTFFFDGVPDTGETDGGMLLDSLVQPDSTGITDINIIAEKRFTYHYPYLHKECESCHDRAALGQFTESQPGLCYQCHDDYSLAYNYLHGPVAGGYCTSCHSPHMSESEKLLLRKGQQLCLYCHDPDGVFKNEIHQDIEDVVCTECHNPHGGGDRFIID